MEKARLENTAPLVAGDKELIGIIKGKRHTVLFKPIFGVLNQPKFLSLKYCPLTIELEWNNDEYANIIEPSASSNYDAAYPNGTTSKDFQIENCVVRADIVRIDRELQNKFDDHLNTGGKIPFKYTTYYSQGFKYLVNLVLLT